MSIQDVQENICKHCSNQFAGRFCNQCGEKVYSDHDKSIKHLFEEAFHFLTHFEGKFFNTLKVIILKPGRLSLDFCGGVRKKYFKPLSFFLMLVIVYLLFPFFDGLNMKLYFHEDHDFYGGYAIQKTAQLREEKKLTNEELTERFQRKSEKTSKFLLFTMIPFGGLVSMMLGFKKRRFYFDHFIFNTEACSFFLLWGFLLFPLAIKIAQLIGVRMSIVEWQIGLGILIVFILYVSIASRRFFGFKKWYSFTYALLLSFFLAVFLQFVYKFILFFLTIHLV